MTAVILVAFISSHVVIKHVFAYLVRRSGKEMVMLGGVAIAFAMLLVCVYLSLVCSCVCA